jgi:trimethylamine:corrinoid methyltransferase-like protein
MRFRHLPLRLSGGSQTSIVPSGAGEHRLNTLAGVVAGLNTDLDSATWISLGCTWSWKVPTPGL